MADGPTRLERRVLADYDAGAPLAAIAEEHGLGHASRVSEIAKRYDRPRRWYTARAGGRAPVLELEP